MPRKQKTGSALGNALRRRTGVAGIQSTVGKHVAKADGGDAMNNLESYLDGSSLDDFLANAVLSGREFVAERQNFTIVEAPGQQPVLSEQEKKEIPEMDFSEMKVPRRPSWTKTMTPEELNEREREAFLNWRRDIAEMESAFEDLSVTPFEKNLEVWRQLWRVIERSDVVIQIVDARNPLFYRSKDLEKYVKEVDGHKRPMLVVNKSDFLTKEQRAVWAEYFNTLGVEYVFFSAKLAQQKLDDEAKLQKEIEEYEQEHGAPPPPPSREDDEAQEDEENPILSREELLEYLTDLSATVLQREPRSDQDGKVKFGMVGFPNVGKSSVINALLGAAANTHGRRVAVGATPGKTKHFQTHILSSDVMLCDCPGLVFPSFVNSTSEMICCGVLSLAQMRAHIEPSKLLCRRIPKVVLEATYGIKIPTLKSAAPTDPVDPYAFLEAYAQIRGFMTTGKGSPDTSRAARVVLKDYVNGKLLYCHPPPELDDDLKHLFDPHKLAELHTPSIMQEQVAAEIPADTTVVMDKLEDAEVRKQKVSKRLKKHGRKGRKGRDKNPYDDSDMLGDQARGLVHQAGRRGQQQGSFTRATMPHHFTYTGANPGM